MVSASGQATLALAADAGSQEQAVARRSATVDGFAPQRLEAFVRHAYEQLERYAAGPTVDLAFTLSAFETIYAERFDQIAYSDLATLPSGEVIDVLRQSRTENYNGDMVSWVRYLPSWSCFEPPPDSTHERSVMLSSSVAEVFNRAASAKDDPELRKVVAFTRYKVRVSLRGRTREYTAAALWIPVSGSENVTMRILDHITQGVPEAATEQRHSFSEIEDERRSRRDQLRPEPPAGATAGAQGSISQEEAPHSPPRRDGNTCGQSSESVDGRNRQGSDDG